MKDYQTWLRRLAALEEEAAAVGPDDIVAPSLPELEPGAPVALLCSPHPDDEVITGALPLRLRREGWRVVNLALTLGSNAARRRERQTELERCCAFIGFENRLAGGKGLERVSLRTMEEDPDHWAQIVAAVAADLAHFRPRVVFFPHAADFHPTHAGSQALAELAIEKATLPQAPWVVETEFWAPMRNPNLLVASSLEDVATLLGGLRQHEGEVARNPYHLRLPAWMSDTVRRGSEVLGGPGMAAENFAYGTLYRRRHGAEPMTPTVLPPEGVAGALFPG